MHSDLHSENRVIFCLEVVLRYANSFLHSIWGRGWSTMQKNIRGPPKSSKTLHSVCTPNALRKWECVSVVICSAHWEYGLDWPRSFFVGQVWSWRFLKKITTAEFCVLSLFSRGYRRGDLHSENPKFRSATRVQKYVSGSAASKSSKYAGKETHML